MAHGPCHCLPLCTHQIVPRFTRPLIEFSCALNTANFTQDHRTANCVRCDGRFHFGKRFPGSCPLWCSGCTTASDRDGEQRPRDQDQDEDEDEAARCGDVYKMTNCADIATCWLSAHAATLLTEEGRGGVSRGLSKRRSFSSSGPAGPTDHRSVLCARAHSSGSIWGSSWSRAEVVSQVRGRSPWPWLQHGSMKIQRNKEINKTGNGIKQNLTTTKRALRIKSVGLCKGIIIGDFESPIKFYNYLLRKKLMFL